jgi:hypothetical protein
MLFSLPLAMRKWKPKYGKQLFYKADPDYSRRLAEGLKLKVKTLKPTL